MLIREHTGPGKPQAEEPFSTAQLAEAAAAAAPRMEGEPIIHVEGLRRSFGSLEAVKGISFDVYPGEIFGFLGPNGAGKSTTINILCTLLKPTGGTATLAGYDISRDQNRVRQSIGLVFQDPSLDDRLTADENLRFHAAIYGLSSAVSRERRDTMLRMVDLYDRRNHLVATFSGGMKRAAWRLRVACCTIRVCSFWMNPRLAWIRRRACTCGAIS
jgi:ABC-2 type transport system ATP-binding protein